MASSTKASPNTSARTGNGSHEPAAKRRKVRRGTRSCWECRRRKLKCVFDAPDGAICANCHRRGAKCVGQEFPEEISSPLDRSLQMGDRVVRVEALVGQLLDKVSDGSERTRGVKPGHGIPTPASVSVEPSLVVSLSSPSVDSPSLDGDTSSRRTISAYGLSGSDKYSRLSRFLHGSLPSTHDNDLLIRAQGDSFTLFHRMLTVPYSSLEQESASSSRLFGRPGSDAHPTLIARHMLYLATVLQHSHPSFLREMEGLSEPPGDIMKRLADTAISLVTTNDDLVSNIEGLVCIMMESYYHANAGNLRKGLLAIRRAMNIAQLMNFHRPQGRMQRTVLDPETDAYPQFVWFRIVFAERHLCLMLGVSQGTLDQSMGSAAMLRADTPIGRLERIHCVIASRILQRNQADPSSCDFALTQELDEELRRAAEDLPSKWWLTANLATSVHKPEALFWDMRRLFAQLFHYHLLNQLHLPYMLHSSGGPEYASSRISCINASREVLSRFVMFRSFNRVAFSCRSIDLSSLTAAMTLVTAHLDGHRAGIHSPMPSDNLWIHQRRSDQAMMEQVQENMEEVSRLNDDAIGAQSAELLRRLLVIEDDAARGQAHRAESVSVQMPNADEQAEELGTDSNGAACVYIPQFGVIKIAREDIPSTTSGLGAHPTREDTFGVNDTLTTDALCSPSSMPEALPQPSSDWALQGVDLAFFDSLMRCDDGTAWPTWLNDLQS